MNRPESILGFDSIAAIFQNGIRTDNGVKSMLDKNQLAGHSLFKRRSDAKDEP